MSLDERLKDVESNLIVWALKTSHGNKSKAAELLQIKRSTLGDRIRRLSLMNKEVNRDRQSTQWRMAHTRPWT